MSKPMSNNLMALLASPPQDRAHAADWRRQALKATLAALLAAGIFAGWSAAAPLAGAVVAPARLKAELNRKTVQHQEGGIVREILVRDGQRVKAGDPLLVVGDMRSEAELSILQDQLRAARVRAARAEAESRMAPRFELPQALADDSAAAGHLERERAVFAAHRHALEEQTALLHDQVRQAQAQAQALVSQIAATEMSARLSDEELAINEKLAAEGFVHRTRLLGLHRASADYRSRAGESRSDLASARQRAGEIQSRIAQLRLQYQTQATDDLKEAVVRMREIEERLRPLKDNVARQTVRAPVDGTVMSLNVAAPGAVIGPRDPLLDVVPAREKLVVEARIAPQDVEHVHVESRADVRLLGGDARNVSPMPAKVVFVSPDRMTQPETGEAWFTATVEVDATELKRQLPRLRLQAGMPAELYVTTPDRTLVEYLAKPLGLFALRAMREP